MSIKVSILSVLLGSISCAAYAATITTGNALLVPASGAQGGEIRVGRSFEGGDGTFTVDGGTVINLESGSSSDEFFARPKVDVGEGRVGEFVAEGTGTTINLIGTNSGSKLEIGDEPTGDGTVIIRDGATVNLSGGPRDLSQQPDGQFPNVFAQFGEDGGTGRLIVDNAQLNMVSNSFTSMFFGSNAGSVGEGQFVNGADVQLDANGPGSDGTGPNVFDSAAFVAIGTESQGSLLIDNSRLGLSAAAADTSLFIGRFGGSAELTVDNGAEVELIGGTEGTRMLVGGWGEGTSGIARVQGGSNVLLDGRAAFLGVGGNDFDPVTFDQSETTVGQMFISEGSTVSVIADDMSATTVRLGAAGPESGEVGFGLLDISGAGTLLETNGIVRLGKSSGEGISTGLLTVRDEAVLAAKEVRIESGSVVNGSGGTIAADTYLQAGGVLAPGSSPGTLSIDGDLIITGGTLEWEIGALAQDRLNVTGDVTATSMFDLVISFVDGYKPIAGDSFSLFGDDPFSDSFAAFADVSFFGSARGLDLSDLSSGRITVTGVAAVPLPASSLLLLCGLGGLFVAKRRKAST